MILLLLFPAQALAPFFLLVLPLFSAAPADDASGYLKLLLALGIAALVAVVALARAVLLIPPAMELLHDGAAGAKSPPDWYWRGLGRHWWKRISMSVAEWSVSSAVSIVAQFVLNIAMTLLIIPFIPLMAIGDATFLAFYWVFILFVFSIFYLVFFVFRFLLESLGAYLLAAMTDRNLPQSFATVFGRQGMRRLPKLLGGRFLVGAVSTVFQIIAWTCCFVAMGAATSNGPSIGIPVLLFTIFAACICIFIASCLSIYRNAFEFCVFQEIKNQESETLASDTGKILSKNSE